ncbi:MAG: lmo0937 family membrane protein [Bacteroidia bacterium]
MLFKQTKKELIIGNYLYLIALFMFIIWAIGFFMYDADDLIHILLICALVLVLIHVLRRKKLFNT